MIKKYFNNHKTLCISVIINLCILLLLSLLFGFHYELSDDWCFSENIADGNYDYVYCNYFIQLISGLLQKLIFPVNAFMLLQLMLGFVSMVTISYIFLESFGFKKGILFILIVESIFAINIYTIITFTKTAAILATAGGLMMLWAYHNKKKSTYSIFGVILVILGSFYRFMIFYSVLAVFGFTICALIINKLKKPIFKSLGDILKEIFTVKTISLLLVTFISVFGLHHISRAIIFSHEGMDYYREYNSLRSSVVDFALPIYGDMQEEYNEIGISANDIKMLKFWYLDDDGIASVEMLEKISALKDSAQLPLQSFADGSIFLDEIMKMVELSPEGILRIAYIGLAVAVLVLYKKKGVIHVLLVSAAIECLHIYLWLGGRSVYRAVFSIWFAAVVLLLYSTRFLEHRDWVKKRKEERENTYYPAFASLCGGFTAVFILLTSLVSLPQLSLKHDTDYEELEKYIVSSNKTFALSRHPFIFLRNSTQMDNALLLAENKAFDKCVYFGTPYFAHPSYNKMLEDAGIDNLYTDLIDNPDLYFVNECDIERQDDIEKFLRYLNEQYGQNAKYGCKLVAKADIFEVYKIVTVKKK